MSANSKIEWTDHTFNPWIGCTKVGPGCDHCYAERSTPARVQGVAWGPDAPRQRTSPGNWALPRRWNAQHQAFFNLHGRRQRVFCASLADVFDNQVDTQWLADLWKLIEETPHLDWLLLTKRIGNARGSLPRGFDAEWYPHLSLGATIVNQEEADRDIPKLLALPAAKRFLSMEPLLGPVDLSKYLNPVWCEDCDWNGADCAGPEDGDSECPKCGSSPVFFRTCEKLDWVIAGGESGPDARPMHPDWARSLRDQSAAAGVPFLFKQWGEWISACQEDCPNGPPFSRWQWADGTAFQPGDGNRPIPLFCRAGKKSAGRQLDGITHDGFPA